MTIKTKWYKNKSMIKGIIALIALALSAFGYSLTEDNQNVLTDTVTAVIQVVEQVDASNDQ